MSALQQHIPTLETELNWFVQVLHERFNAYFEGRAFEEIPPPLLEDGEAGYARFVLSSQLDDQERLLLMLVLVPHLKPEVLDVFFSKNQSYDRGFTEFGGYLGKYHGGFLPTGETALFILSAGDLQRRLSASRLFADNHLFQLEEVLKIVDVPEDEPLMSRPITISTKYLNYFTTGELAPPKTYAQFPAKKITTQLGWSDLVVERSVREDVDQIIAWIKHGDYLMQDMQLSQKVKPGYRSLFYGPPGTGKTLTACLLAKETGCDVYRVDLSAMVSKYIGETEKNLARVFDYAERQNWILFFDEADALFGKRTQTSSSNDRFANQEVSYLLQRVEDFEGVVILASNLKSNIDEAFSRRFQSIVYFGMPNAKSRHSIWTNIFNGPLKPESKLDLQQLSRQYEISGGAAINVYRYGALKAMQRGSECILEEDIIRGIEKEFQKDGKTL